MEQKAKHNDKVKFLRIADIKQGTRFRKEFGDMSNMEVSIRSKGVITPITVSSDMVLLSGQRRLKAATTVGLITIPALVREIEGEIDLREIELTENLCRLDFTWSERASLVSEIDKLYKDKHVDWSGRKTANLLDRGVASVARDLKLAAAVKSLPELAEVRTADDAMKVVAKMEESQIVKELRNRQQVTVLDKGIAAMLKLADSAYVVGDTFKGLAAMPTNGRVDLIECDPPYGIDLNAVRRGGDRSDSSVQTYEEVPAIEYDKFLANLCTELYRVAAPNAWLVFWFGPTWHTQVMSNLRAAHWLVDDIPCIWVKTQGQTNAPEHYLARTYEPFFLCRKGQPIIVRRGRSNVFSFQGESGTGKYHPTQRPMGLIEEILRTLGFDLQNVLVPFLGSGTTIRAAYKTGMKAHGWDMNGEYKNRFMLEVEKDARDLTKVDEGDK